MTRQQHKALFKYFEQLAAELTAHGVTQKMFIDNLQGWDIPINKEFLHTIWKMKQEKMGLGDSTQKLSGDQLTRVYDTVNHFTGTVFGVSQAFPSEEELIHRYDEVVKEM